MKIPQYLNPSNHQGRLTLLTIIVVLFIFLIKTLPIIFQESDDYAYSLILSGVYSGTPSALTVYEGYIYGLLISTFYRLFPKSIEWYILSFHVLYIASFVVISYKLLQSKTTDIIKLVALTAFSFVQLYLLLSPQFTILAGELALAAVICLIGKPSKNDYILAVILLFISSQIRMNALLMIVVPLCPLLFFPINLRNRAYWIKPIILLGVLATLLSVNAVSESVYYKEAAWVRYSEYNTTRGIIEQNCCRIQGAEILTDPIKKTEYINMCNFHLIDGNILSIDDLNKCAQHLQSRKLTVFKINVIPYIRELNSNCFYIAFIWLCTVLLFAIKKKQWWDVLTVLMTACAFIAELLYCMTTTFAKERLIICFMMYLFTLCTVLSYRIFSKRQMTCLAGLVLVLISITYTIKSYDWESNVIKRINLAKNINEIINESSYEKILLLGIEQTSDAYHVQDTPCEAKVIRKGWLNNIPHHAAFYSGYVSLVNRVPILISKKEKTYMDNIDFIEKYLQTKGIDVKRKVLFDDDEKTLLLFTK